MLGRPQRSIPCVTALRCLCGGGVLPEAEGQPLDACVETFVRPARSAHVGRPVRLVVSERDHTLAEAITAFAGAHGGAFTMNEDVCDVIAAFY